MKPGPELDVVVHEHFVKKCAHVWLRDGHGDETLCRKCGASHLFTAIREVLRYSTEMGAAWTLVETLRKDGVLVTVSAQPDGSWVVAGDPALNPREDGTADGYDDTMPGRSLRTATSAHGICLLAVEDALAEGALNEFLVDCAFCGRCRIHGHEPGCPFPAMHPDLPETFRTRHGDAT